MKVLFVANTDKHINLCYRPYMKYLKENNFTVHTATNTDVMLDYSIKKYKIPIYRSPFHVGNIRAILKLRKIINNEQYDIVSCSTPMGGVIARVAAIKAREKYNTKVLYTAHGFHFFSVHGKLKGKIYYLIEKVLAKYTDILVTINDEDYNIAKENFNTDTRFIKGIGFNKERLKNKLTKEEIRKMRSILDLKESDYVIIYIAEISKRKRQKYLIKALSKINDDNIKLLLVGDDILNTNIKKYIHKLSLDSRVKILGFRDDISNLLDISDLVVSVSSQEGLPLNIMEAMYKNKTIIVTDCRGNRDLIKNNYNGIVVPISDIYELNKNIVDLKKNKNKALKMGAINKDIINEYSVDNILSKYVDIYEELLK